MKLNVIIFGVTGMVGEGVLLTALQHPEVESILVIGRKPCGILHPRVKEILHRDFFDYAAIEDSLRGYNACFFCLGVTSLGKKEPEYTRLTYDLTMAAARTLSRLNPAMTFCYVSGQGTDSTERRSIMWARVKGKTENDLGALPFKAVYLFRPGYIKPVNGQKSAHWFSTAFAPMYPLMERLLPHGVCTLKELGLAMIAVSIHGSEKRFLENRDIARLGTGTTNPPLT